MFLRFDVALRQVFLYDVIVAGHAGGRNNDSRVMGGKTMLKDKKGFTLIELLIVVAIIAILASIAIPQFSAYRVKSYNAAAQADLRNLRSLMEATQIETQAYPIF
jgi:type IV pilus assembly protein PilA